MLSSLSTSDQPGILKCTRAWCKTCPFICNVEIISGPKRSIKITVHFTCTSTNVIYCITCTLCKKLYIGETERQIGDDSEKSLVMLKETAKTHVNRELRSFCPKSVSPQVVLPQLKVISLPRPEVGLPEFFSYDLESKCIYSTGKKPCFQILSAIDQSTDFVWLCCYSSATILLIYVRNQTNTFRLGGSLNTHMFNKKGLNGIWYSTGKSRGRFMKLYKYDRPLDCWRSVFLSIFSLNLEWDETWAALPPSLAFFSTRLRSRWLNARPSDP